MSFNWKSVTCPAVALLICSLAAQTAHAYNNQVGFALSLRVPASCTINSIEANSSDVNSVTITADCNAEYFAVHLGGNLAQAQILQVQSATARTHSTSSGFSAHAVRPGTHKFTLTFEESTEIKNGMTAQIEIV